MKKEKVTLKEAVKFHGHLGPYLVLGILAGEMALQKLRGRKYFGLEIKAWGANKKPKSCLIDGLQLSTGATYGKGNISKYNGCRIKIEFRNRENQKKIVLFFRDSLIKQLSVVKSHRDSEILARRLYKTDCDQLFDQRPITYYL